MTYITGGKNLLTLKYSNMFGDAAVVQPDTISCHSMSHCSTSERILFMECNSRAYNIHQNTCIGEKSFCSTLYLYIFDQLNQ